VPCSDQYFPEQQSESDPDWLHYLQTYFGAQDPDGEGVQDLQVLGAINLKANTEYLLSVIIENCLEDPCEDITEEIAEEAEEHQFFFAFTNDAFTSPAGNGNIDNASDPINYIGYDGNGNPVGLNTNWTAGNPTTAASFTVRLQHQPDVKTATSGANDGDTDFELQFVLNIQYFFLESLTLTSHTLQSYIRKELHFYDLLTFSLTSFTSTTVNIE
jgi:hypothetical protein